MADVGPTESELKIPTADLAAVRDRLAAVGGTLLQASAREVNVLYDTSQRSIYGTGRALRLRSFAGRWILTFKGPISYHGNVKCREELELGVDDGETLAAILFRIGFLPLARYEKDREAWSLDGVQILLDHTPMGDFVELEGAEEGLAETATAIGLDPAAAVRGSYVSLWSRYREEHADAYLPVDMVFGD